MANILVPTDFSPASIKLAEQALGLTTDMKVNIILFHAFEQSSLPFELLRPSYKDPSAELMTENFRQACKQLKDEYGQRVGKIVVRCMQGDTRAMFRNFIEANDVNMIFYPSHYVFTKAHKQSVNPAGLFTKCGIPVVREVPRKKEPVFSNKKIFTTEPQQVYAKAGSY
ncbi:MAG: universal stress protein [Chitinophagales bacterium]|nr:universal stress protein [Chitinophagales bacterium]